MKNNKILKFYLKTKETRKATKFFADVFVSYEYENNKINITGFNFTLLQGTQFNSHQQPDFSNNKGDKCFFDKLKTSSFSLKTGEKEAEYQDIEKKNDFKILKDTFESCQTTLLTFFGWISGNRITGAEENKTKHPLIINFQKKEVPIWQFLKTLTTEENIKFNPNIDTATKNTIPIHTFIDKLSIIEKDTFDPHFLDPSVKEFYIKDWKQLFNNKQEFSERDPYFKQRLIDKYGLKDFVYKEIEKSYIVEGAHIVPVKAFGTLITKELGDSWKNGLLLPVHIHKLFDNGAFYIDASTGKMVFSKDKNFGITNKVKKLFNLENPCISLEFLEEKEELLKYHKEYIFEVGVMKATFPEKSTLKE